MVFIFLPGLVTERNGYNKAKKGIFLRYQNGPNQKEITTVKTKLVDRVKKMKNIRCPINFLYINPSEDKETEQPLKTLLDD
jgi:hypothetical protein